MQETVEKECREMGIIIDKANEDIEYAERRLKELQKICNHSKHEYHHRKCVEDDCYYTCLICGLQYDKT